MQDMYEEDGQNIIISCPNCKTKFRLKREGVDYSKIKARCSRCGHVFPLGPILNKRYQDNQQLKYPVDEGDALKDQQPEATEIDDIKKPESKGKKQRRWLKISIPVIVVVGIASLFYLRAAPQDSWLKKVFQRSNFMQDIGQKKIYLINVEGKFLTNIHEGMIYVISGKIRNDYSGPRTNIRIKAILRDSKGKIIRQKEFFAGNFLSKKELKKLTKKAIEERLLKKISTSVPPGTLKDFMVVFFDFPKNVTEYDLIVISSSPGVLSPY